MVKFLELFTKDFVDWVKILPSVAERTFEILLMGKHPQLKCEIPESKNKSDMIVPAPTAKTVWNTDVACMLNCRLCFLFLKREWSYLSGQWWRTVFSLIRLFVIRSPTRLSAINTNAAEAVQWKCMNPK